MELKKETVYLFRYRDETSSFQMLVDSVEGRRHIGTISPGKQQFYGSRSLNYKGTGAEPQTIEAELVGENVLLDQGSNVQIELLYKLPDVNAYAKAQYSGYEDPYSGLRTSLDVTFLDKIIS